MLADSAHFGAFFEIPMQCEKRLAFREGMAADAASMP
jgi:hypothetical protein